jgi:uncharacterized protein
MFNFLSQIDIFLGSLLVKLIKMYQKTFSFDHGIFKVFYPHGFCRFRPTCSDYAIDAIIKKGALKGLLQSAYRILRCNPWNKGGWDPVK